MKTPERRHWRRSGVFINFEHISPFSSVSIIDFEQVDGSKEAYSVPYESSMVELFCENI